MVIVTKVPKLNVITKSKNMTNLQINAVYELVDEMYEYKVCH